MIVLEWLGNHYSLALWKCYMIWIIFFFLMLFLQFILLKNIVNLWTWRCRGMIALLYLDVCGSNYLQFVAQKRTYFLLGSKWLLIMYIQIVVQSIISWLSHGRWFFILQIVVYHVFNYYILRSLFCPNFFISRWLNREWSWGNGTHVAMLVL